jgi:hypothetical protein
MLRLGRKYEERAREREGEIQEDDRKMIGNLALDESLGGCELLFKMEDVVCGKNLLPL